MKKYLLFFCLNTLLVAGFSLNTLIKIPAGFITIQGLTINAPILSYDQTNNTLVTTNILHKNTVHVQQYCAIIFEDDVLYASPDQKFYIPLRNNWTSASELSDEDFLLTYDGRYIRPKYILRCNETIEVCDIEVFETHTFFVGKYGILVHNHPALILAAEATPVIVEVVAAVGTSLLAYVSAKFLKDTFEPKHKEKKNNKSDPKSTDAQAPGMPTAADGYEPPKNWDGKKRRNPKTGKFGWPDKNGNIWVPSGPKGHGGPHWDVQDPTQRRRYDNVYPGGIIREGSR